jgi:hypothetical protein
VEGCIANATSHYPPPQHCDPGLNASHHGPLAPTVRSHTSPDASRTTSQAQVPNIQKAFWSGWIIHSLKNNLFGCSEETHVSYVTKPFIRGRSVLHIVSLWELSHLLKEIFPTFQGYQVWANHHCAK